MKITIHSHARSGSNFLLNNLEFLLKDTDIAVNKKFLDGLDDGNNFKVAIFREPVATIISAYTHAEYFNKDHDGIFRFGSISYQVDEYVKFLTTLESNLDNIHAYTFDKLEYALFDIASNFVEIPKDFVPKFPENTNEHLATAKDSSFYHTIINELYNYKIFDPANEVYNRIVSKIGC